MASMSSAGDRQIPNPLIHSRILNLVPGHVPSQYHDYIQKFLHFFILTPYQIGDQIWKRLDVVISHTSTNFSM